MNNAVNSEEPVISGIRFVALFLALLLASCSPRGNRDYSRTAFLMDTVFEITVRTHDSSLAEKALDRSFARIKEIEDEVSIYRRGSIVSAINNGERRPATDDVIALIAKAKEVWALTEGAFDITVYPLKRLWEKVLDETVKRVPDEKTVKEKVALVNSANLEVDGRRIRFLKKGMGMDMGGIAKGYALSSVVEVLKSAGIKDALVNGGGEIYALGKRGNRAWRVGIRDPGKKGEILGTVNLSNRAVATSGDYERFVVVSGRRYHHIVDPRTGYPVALCRSVTVIADDAVMADALSTGIFVLGPEKGMAVIEKLESVEGIIVDKNGNMLVSSGLKGKIRYACGK